MKTTKSQAYRVMLDLGFMGVGAVIYFATSNPDVQVAGIIIGSIGALGFAIGCWRNLMRRR